MWEEICLRSLTLKVACAKVAESQKSTSHDTCMENRWYDVALIKLKPQTRQQHKELPMPSSPKPIQILRSRASRCTVGQGHEWAKHVICMWGKHM